MNLLILGAGQYGAVVKELAIATRQFEMIDFLDDNKECAVGKFNEYKKFIGCYSHAIVAIGNPDIRLNLLESLNGHFKIATLIHPTAYVSPSAVIGSGCVIEPMAVVHTNARLGMGVLISSGAIVNHGCMVGDGCHIDAGAVVTKETIVKAKAYLSANSAEKNIF